MPYVAIMERYKHKFMSPVQLRRFLSENVLALTGSLLIFVAIALQSGLLYMRSTEAMQHQLAMRLQTAAALGAQRFTGEEIDAITGIESFKTPLYIDMVSKLQDIRTATPNIDYAYIMRKTQDPMKLEFVADADSLVVSDASSYPGDLYDISGINAMQGPAFSKPSVDKEITTDQWGQLISGYAPIYRADGSVAAIIGIDMDAADFVMLSRQAFSRLALITMLSIGLIIVISVTYILWERRMRSIHMIQSERSAMLALATHQLGGPISSIRWWLEVMGDDGLCTKENACGQISRSVQKMNAIIQQLIDVERQEHGKFSYNKEKINIQNLIDVATESIPQLQKQKHVLKVSVDKNLTAKLDKELIASALGELMENAMTYSQAGTTVEVSAKKVGKWLYLSIKDNGTGVPEDEQDRIFQKMTRGSNATHFRPNGNGLGLYVVHLIAEKAGGSVKLTSTEGEGSTFTLRLPA